uniref:AAA+ ATPase domain-containing protein n=1 Tax=viral metagenome TaxID=1070528 RepID=A0A6C0JKW0_9ZZZZ
MPTLTIHQAIKDKLSYFHKIHKIPNIIFHGPSGSGKRTIVNDFIHKIYDNDKEKIKLFTMYVNCAHGKGIKFIRDELKFFAKTHINSNGGDVFKSIILLNADKLTMDAQSALRRCIELFSHNTRFFIIIEDKYNLLKPILSRFCEIYVPQPEYKSKIINLYKYNIDEVFKMSDTKIPHLERLKKTIEKTMLAKKIKLDDLISFSLKLYEKGYSAMDIIELLETKKLLADKITNEKKYELLITYNKVRKEFRNEKLLILFILNFLFLSSDLSLENITFM